MKKQKVLLLALAALTALPASMPLISQSALAVEQAGQTLQQEKLALGATLNSQQAQQTIQLLGASSVTAENTIYVDGVMIDRYLNIGSDASTDVYSSVYIKPQAAGTGIKVQIVTPENITDVSATTYQNAAITAGAQNTLLKIGSFLPVTGEGALTGLYALLESQGVVVKQHDMQTAQNEISVVSNVKTETGLTDSQVNVIIAEIKKEVASQVQNNGQANSTEIVNTVINNVINNTEVNGDGNVVDNSVATDVTISDETKQELEQYANDFAQTDAAANKDTVGQLDASIEDKKWGDILAQLQPSMTIDQIKEVETPDFSDTEKYHEILPALYNRFKEAVEQGIRVDDIYAHTFVLEAIQPDLTVETKAELDNLRELLYQYTATFEGDLKEAAENEGFEFQPIKDQWMAKLQEVENLESSDVALAEIIQLVANATGFAPQVYTYTDIEQDDKVISLSVAEDSPTKMSTLARFEYDLETGVISEVDPVSMEAVPLSQDTYDFNAVYGVNVENNYLANEVPVDYMIPGYTPVESTEEETTLEEMVEEPVGSVETQTPEEEPAEDVLEEEAPSEKNMDETVPAEETEDVDLS
ncbi:DUF1002 domain-containing protein [Facklamia sp. 7083-14-GEN3]|uniref:DUF1002 domain-containing protein n=1 Tax=Facklamia sp. 7083-14-GEN3 TaxID=2973478 RepID=UPI00215BF575|nr:DUF1002 domain-containing protein [Facklamia sp. 7083-14-GEN3]MCR8969325.1 DUF1002 domain-containing protein [Facklamia sp. 7083-14-GEN3]